MIGNTRVPKEGLEPSHPKAQEPKSCVSTSSTTPAHGSRRSLTCLNLNTKYGAQILTVGSFDRLWRAIRKSTDEGPA